MNDPCLNTDTIIEETESLNTDDLAAGESGLALDNVIENPSCSE